MKSVLFTGSSGQLGFACKEIFPSKFNSLFTSKNAQNESCFLDISNEQSIKTALDRFRPDVVVNLAAYTDVDGCEKSPKVSKEINLEGLKNLCIILTVISFKFQLTMFLMGKAVLIWRTTKRTLSQSMENISSLQKIF